LHHLVAKRRIWHRPAAQQRHQLAQARFKLRNRRGCHRWTHVRKLSSLGELPAPRDPLLHDLWRRRGPLSQLSAIILSLVGAVLPGAVGRTTREGRHPNHASRSHRLEEFRSPLLLKLHSPSLLLLQFALNARLVLLAQQLLALAPQPRLPPPLVCLGLVPLLLAQPHRCRARHHKWSRRRRRLLLAASVLDKLRQLLRRAPHPPSLSLHAERERERESVRSCDR
jgi:hypothetical protein